MSFTKKYFLFFLIASSFSSCFSLEITWDSQGQTQYGWLKVPDANGSVYIKNQKTDGSAPSANGDFIYINKNKKQLLKGLYYWKIDQNSDPTIYSPISNKGEKSEYKYKLGVGGGYSAFVKGYNPYDDQGKRVHPSTIFKLLQVVKTTATGPVTGVKITGINQSTDIGWLEILEIKTNGQPEAVRVKISKDFKNLFVQEQGKSTFTYTPKKSDNFDFEYVGSSTDGNPILQDKFKGLFYWREANRYSGSYFSGSGDYRVHQVEFAYDKGSKKFYRYRNNTKNMNNPFNNLMWGTPTLSLANELDVLIPRRAVAKAIGELSTKKLEAANLLFKVPKPVLAGTKLDLKKFNKSGLPPGKNFNQLFMQNPKAFFQKYEFFPLVIGGLEAQFQFYRNNLQLAAKNKLSNFSLEKPNTWFQTSQSWRSFDNVLYYNEQNKLFYFKPSGAQFAYQAGNLSLETIKELNEKIFDQQGHIKKPGVGTFNVIAGTDPLKNPMINQMMDIGSMQADPNNKDAVFQLASNFHGLEARCDPAVAQEAGLLMDGNKKYKIPFRNFQKPDVKQYYNNTLRQFLVYGATEMSLQAVQGENAAISAAPGFLLKMYYKPYHSLLKNYQNGMNIKGKLITLPVDETGKVNFKSKVFKQVVNLTAADLNDKDFIQKFSANIEISFLHDTEVIGGFSNVFNEPDDDQVQTDSSTGNKYSHGKRAGFYHEYKGGTGQFINQVSTSALDLLSWRIEKRNYGGHDNDTVERREFLAKLLLYPMYEGVLKVAKAHGKTKVFLTLVGAGSFKNKIEWIRDVLEAQMDFIKQSGLDVYLVVFDRRAVKYPDIEQEIFNMVNETGGTYTIYEGKHKYEYTDKAKAKPKPHAPVTPPATGIIGDVQKALTSLQPKLKALAGQLGSLMGGQGV